MTIYAANRRRTWPYKSTRKNKKRQKTSKNDDFSEENSN
uniref:Uncharacterized protein n=2 Tax=Bursaphelenchus xylophilus TaxID=6326 RepID=A0A1I7SNM8_BURXY